ncbi:MAG: hypothetical protein KIT83_02930 [Bryobacterales bacterium]|nr:hypothetical protein [Bryobacterales bacterium]
MAALLPLTAQIQQQVRDEPVRLLRETVRIEAGPLDRLDPFPMADAPRVMREKTIEADGLEASRIFASELPGRRGSSGLSASGTRGAGRLRSTRREPNLPPIELRLFPDTVFLMRPDRVLDHEGDAGSFAPFPGPRGRTVSGVLTAGGEGTAILSYYDGAISASVRLTNGEFYEWDLVPGEGGVASGVVRQVEGTARWPGSDEVVIPDFDEEPPADRLQSAAAPSLLDASWTRFSTEERILTVAAYYTRRVMEARGGPSGFFAWLHRLEEESNAAMRNSGLSLEYRFVTAILVDHDDSASDMSFNSALTNLRTVYDPIAQPRARLAAMFVNPPLPQSGSFTVGIAYLRTPGSGPQRHSVTHQLYAGGTSLTFAHEAGHNFGCVHDVDNGGQSGGLFGDSRGYQQRDVEPKFFTVMAYSCSGCRAVPYYSEPSVLYETIPVGISSTRCAATIEREASDISWGGAPPPAGCVMEVYPAELRLSPEAQDVQLEVRTGPGCSWQVSDFPARTFVEDLDAGQARTGPGWLRLRIPANSATSLRTDNLEVRGVPLRITQDRAGGTAVTPSQRMLRFEASTLPDTLQERCVFLTTTPGNSSLDVRMAGLPGWLSFDRARVDTPDFLCLRVNPRGLAAGTERAAIRLTSTNLSSPTDILLNVEVVVSAEVTRVLMAPRAMAFRASVASLTTAIQTLEVSGHPEMTFTPQSGAANWLRVQPERHPDGYRVDVWADATGLEPGVHTARLLVGCQGDSCGSRMVPIHFTVEQAPASGPRIVSGGVVSAAGFSAGLSVGSWMSMFGERLASNTRGWAAADFAGDLLPTVLDGVRVLVDGFPAPVSFISPSQINFQCPEMERTGWVPVEVVTAEGRDQHWAFVEAENPGVFLLNGADVAALHEDTTPAAQEGALGPGAVTRASRPGDVLSLYGTGFGATLPRVFAGRIYQGEARLPPNNPVRVTIGGQSTEILFAGQSGAGLNQINLRVPNLPPGDHPVRVTVGVAPAAWRGTLRVE